MKGIGKKELVRRTLRPQWQDQDWPEGYDLTSLLHGDKTTAGTKPMTAEEQATQHTPGPWYISTRYEITTAGRARCICKVYTLRSQHAPDGDEPGANARLIAAAPDLLALVRLVRQKSSDMELISLIDAAIAKASGQPTSE